MQPGDSITVSALHADGQWYRRWRTTIESIDDAGIVTFFPAASEVENASGKVHRPPLAIRSHYWFDKPYNLLEVLDANGSLNEIYLNVASPPRVLDDGISFVDHELDVTKLAGQPARIVDQDEFEAAIGLYGYSPEFQVQCWQAAEEARQVADVWAARRALRLLRPGDEIEVSVLHADGERYRGWTARVEQIDEERIVESSVKDGALSRGHYWFDRLYNLFEEYDATGALVELYVNIASPPIVGAGRLSYVDFELDVSRVPGGPIEILDEDEFAEACVRYGYAPEFQARCWRALDDARAVIAAWRAV